MTTEKFIQDFLDLVQEYEEDNGIVMSITWDNEKIETSPGEAITNKTNIIVNTMFL